MRKILNLRKGEAGQALLFVTVALGICAIVISATLTLSYTGHRSTEIKKAEMQQYYAADTGIEDALHKIGNQISPLPVISEDPLIGNTTMPPANGYDVSYMISRMAGAYIITSTASYPPDLGGPDIIVQASAPICTLDILPTAHGYTTLDGYITPADNHSYAYLKNASVDLEATAYSGYRFSNWTGNATGFNPNDPTISITMDGDYNIKANFEQEAGPNWLYVIVNPTEGGNPTPSAGNHPGYYPTDVVNLIADPANCYRFIDWTGGPVVNPSDPDYATITMDGNYTITANFTQKVYSLTLSANPPGYGIVAGAGQYECGLSVAIEAEANPGYEFVNWTGGPVDDPSLRITTITMNGDYSIVANFKHNPGFPCLRYGIASTGGGVTINKTVKVEFSTDGDVYINGNMIVDIGAKINGSAYATGSITLRSGAEITGGAYANNGGVSLGKLSIIGGDVYAKGGNIQVGKDATIQGDATASGSITVSGGQIVGQQNPPGTRIFPTFPTNPAADAVWPGLAAAYLDKAEDGGTYPGTLEVGIGASENFGLDGQYITGNLIVENGATLTLGGKAVYVDGYIDISPNCKIIGPGYLVAKGSITMWTNNDVPPSELPLIMSVNGNVYCKNNGILNAVLVAPEGRVTLEENAQVYGAVLGKYISTNNNFSVYYDDSLDDACAP